MGDRANVVVKERDEQVCLYTHWNGSELPSVLQSAMQRGADRVDDFQYLTRIIFCEMVKGREMQKTGFGITQNVGDGKERIITVDVDAKTVQIRTKTPMSFDVFMEASTVEW